jgi:hypothetical protein
VQGGRQDLPVIDDPFGGNTVAPVDLLPLLLATLEHPLAQPTAHLVHDGRPEIRQRLTQRARTEARPDPRVGLRDCVFGFFPVSTQHVRHTSKAAMVFSDERRESVAVSFG